jgi:hypothetical protein
MLEKLDHVVKEIANAQDAFKEAYIISVQVCR